MGQFGGIADEIDGLKRDKNVLMVELVRLRQQQAQADHTVRQLQVMGDGWCPRRMARSMGQG